MWDTGNHHKYKLNISDNKISLVENLNEGCSDFEFFAKNDKLLKLYVIADNIFYQYVGITIQSIKKRLSQGLKAKGKSGYHGYKWKNKNEVNIFIFVFDDATDKEQIENIEAELCFKIREKHGKWCVAQNEIHFNNNFNSGNVIAGEILLELEKNCSYKNCFDSSITK